MVVLWSYHLKHYGDQYCILLLDNCSAHKVGVWRQPPNLHIVFISTNVTNTHQLADMGMIASLKVGYNTQILLILLYIFDEGRGTSGRMCGGFGRGKGAGAYSTGGRRCY